MLTIFSRYWPLLCLLGITACKEDLLETYKPEASGSNIYFKEKYDYALDNQPGNLVNIRYISFGFVAKDKLDSLVKIPVKFTGAAAGADREYLVEVDPASTMRKGIDFEFVHERPVVRANRYVDTFGLLIHRTAAMKGDSLTLGLLLQPNANFSVNMPFKLLTNRRDSMNIVRIDFSVDDTATTPWPWNDPQLGSFFTNYLGDFSSAKLLLMAEVLNFDINLFLVRPSLLADRQALATKVRTWGPYMAYWLAKEKAEGRIYYDADGEEITMGKSSG